MYYLAERKNTRWADEKLFCFESAAAGISILIDALFEQVLYNVILLN